MTVQLNLTFSQPQGRYLFPALSAVAVLAAIGLEGIPLWRPSWTYVITVLFAVCNVAILCALIIPTYWSSNRPIQAMDVIVPDSPMRRTAGPLNDSGYFVRSFVSRADNLSSVEVEMATWGKAIPVRLAPSATPRADEGATRDCVLTRADSPRKKQLVCGAGLNLLQLFRKPRLSRRRTPTRSVTQRAGDLPSAGIRFAAHRRKGLAMA
jgi:hypothetical protein